MKIRSPKEVGEKVVEKVVEVKKVQRSHRKPIEAGGKRQESFRKRPGNAA
jgi:hypothetical protein